MTPDITEDTTATADVKQLYFGEEKITKIDWNSIYLEGQKFPVFLADVFLEGDYKLITEEANKADPYDAMVTLGMSKIINVLTELNFNELLYKETLKRVDNSLRQTFETSISKKYNAAGIPFIPIRDVMVDGVDTDYFK